MKFNVTYDIFKKLDLKTWLQIKHANSIKKVSLVGNKLISNHLLFDTLEPHQQKSKTSNPQIFYFNFASNETFLSNHQKLKTNS